MKNQDLSDGSVTVRLSKQDRKTIEGMASRAGVSRSDVLRALVRAAQQRRLMIDLIDQPRKVDHVHVQG